MATTRLFKGQAPPWGEARCATEFGQALATSLGVPFYFPSPDHPEVDCPRWWERDQGTPCCGCGIYRCSSSTRARGAASVTIATSHEALVARDGVARDVTVE